MNLKEYADRINKLATKYPNAKVIYSRDDEGNGYDEVHYTPSPCKFDGNDIEVDGLLVKDINAVIIN